MIDLNAQDRRLLAALRQDGRASVTRLAQLLGQSRATVQTRMDRLVANGAIERFTVELNGAIRRGEIGTSISRAVQRELAEQGFHCCATCTMPVLEVASTPKRSR